MRILRSAFLAISLLGLSAGAVACGGSDKGENTTPEANPCGGEANPCGGDANPCGGDANPCGGDANPCGGEANPCGGDNPCGGNPCGDWK